MGLPRPGRLSAQVTSAPSKRANTNNGAAAENNGRNENTDVDNYCVLISFRHGLNP